jgi:hypothetical protein
MQSTTPSYYIFLAFLLPLLPVGVLLGMLFWGTTIDGGY